MTSEKFQKGKKMTSSHLSNKSYNLPLRICENAHDLSRDTDRI